MNLTPAINAAIDAVERLGHNIGTRGITDIIDAAAPHIASQAWAEGVRDGERNANLGVATPNPYEAP